MRYIVPTTITDAALVASSLPEDDQPAWNAATTYAVGDRVLRATTHAVYERLVAGTTAGAPEADAVNWVRVGPSNRWAMFDGAVGTYSAAPSSISFTIAPGTVRGLALLDLDIEGATVTMSVGGRTIYTRSFQPIQTQEDCDNWYDYFFEAVQRRSALILDDLPPYSDGQITITLTGSAAGISIGSCVVGPVYRLGDVLAAPRIGITDYSKKDTDEFGTTSVAQRGYARRMSADVVLPSSNVDVATARLARVRAKPVVWVASRLFDSLIVYGWLKDWSVSIPGLINSTCSLEVEGLV